jgi:hypothetical protein
MKPIDQALMSIPTAIARIPVARKLGTTVKASSVP